MGSVGFSVFWSLIHTRGLLASVAPILTLLLKLSSRPNRSKWNTEFMSNQLLLEWSQLFLLICVHSANIHIHVPVSSRLCISVIICLIKIVSAPYVRQMLQTLFMHGLYWSVYSVCSGCRYCVREWPYSSCCIEPFSLPNLHSGVFSEELMRWEAGLKI